MTLAALKIYKSGIFFLSQLSPVIIYYG